jgi:anti-anti-sigma factor
MDFISKTQDGITTEVVDMSRATLKEAGELRKILHQDIQSGCKKLIVDITKCEFIDSTFLGSLVISLKAIKSFGGNLKLVGIQKDVETMFLLTRLDKVFQSYPTSEAAIVSFS